MKRTIRTWAVCRLQFPDAFWISPNLFCYELLLTDYERNEYVYSFGFERAFYFQNLCFRFNRLMTFEYIYAWQCLNISIPEALTLIPQVRKSHKMRCLLKSFTAQHSIPFICQPSWLHTLFISWLHLTTTLSRVCDPCMIMHSGPAIKRLKSNFYLSQTVAISCWRYTNESTDLRWGILINVRGLSSCSDLWLMKMIAFFNKTSEESRWASVDRLSFSL